MNSTIPQHCISVMRAKQLKLSVFLRRSLAIGRQTMNCSESRTTLILDRCAKYHEILVVLNKQKNKYYDKENNINLSDSAYI